MSDLEAAIKKCKHSESGCWYAYLTQAQFLALVAAGAKPLSSYAVGWAQTAVKAGKVSTQWYYFTVNKALAAKLPKIKRSKVGKPGKV